MDRVTVGAAPPLSFNPWRRPFRVRFGWPALLSVAVHVCVGLLAIHAIVRVPQLAPLIHVSLIDPAPPPPAGTGGGTAAPMPAVPVVVPPSVPEPVVENVPPKTHPVPRLHRPAKPSQAPPAAVAPVANGKPSAEPPGQVDGTSGGVPGGSAGGVVGGTGHDLISADLAAHQPILMKKVMPEYPPLARLRGVEGQVLLEAILSPAGDVEPDIKVLQSIPLLDAAAIAAVRRWHFRPAQDDTGEPLRVTLRVPVRFVLQ